MQQQGTRDLRIGYFGSSTGGAAALVAAAELSQGVAAVVSRGGRPDLAGDALPKVQAPTLLIVGGNDDTVIELNEMAHDQMRCEVKLEIIPGATHLFEEPSALEKVGREASMLHLEVLLLIYHCARFGLGNVLEIGPCVGGSTIAAAFGAHQSGTRKEIVTIEAGWSVKHFRLSSRNIVKDLKKNLARFGVAEDVTLINGRSSDEAIISEVHQCFGSREVSFLFSTSTITCVGIRIATVTCLTMPAGL